MTDDPLDPRRLARESIYSAETWRVALDACRGLIPDPALIKLVEDGLSPGFIAALPTALAYAPLTRLVRRGP